MTTDTDPETTKEFTPDGKLGANEMPDERLVLIDHHFESIRTATQSLGLFGINAPGAIVDIENHLNRIKELMPPAQPDLERAEE